MDFNFFQWLRDGVRQSVLLGVSDAVEQIGTPDNSAELHPEIAALLQSSPNAAIAGPVGTATKSTSSRSRGGQTAGRKRLGKSLQDMNSPSK